MANHLASETSPYLLQHAHNPVDWYPWGEEALERARREDKPIFLSIGYAACHWCHVMERESFENEAIAAFLNEHFVSIKVDREERPDLDDIYMAATVALSGSGGWPMTVFLAPDRRPFFAGTYFPPSDRYGRIGFHALLQRIVELWNRQREAVLEQAEELTQHVRSQTLAGASVAVDASALARAVGELDRSFDERWGGFGSAPKFPPHQALGLLLRFHRRSGDPRPLELARKTLDGMKNGGIYDHVAGGFARYSTDEQWLVPHFEKMLYDNAQLTVAYLEAFQISADPEYRRVATETLDYVVREMQGPEGGYYSATDADSEGEEGKFFVFTPDEIEEILGKDAADAFCLYYDVTPQGNWEGKSILRTPRPLAEVAAELGRDAEELRRALVEARAKVYAARQSRVPPLLDDKVLAAWNGLMIGAMAEGHRVLGDPRYLDSARRAAAFVKERLRRADGGLFRTARQGRAHIDAFLEDYAYAADGVLSLYEASGERRWLDFALELAERALADFGAEGGAFHFTAENAEPQIARPREGHDGALPNPNAVLARTLARLAAHLDRDALRHRAVAAITAYGQAMQRMPRAFATALSVVDFLLEPPAELVVVGARGQPETEALLRVLGARYLPNRVVALVDPAAANDSPLTRDKTLVGGRAALYICRNFACQAPITDAEAAEKALEAQTAPTPAQGQIEAARTD